MIFFLATPLLLLSGIPQIIKLIKSKKSDDISLFTYVLTYFAITLILIKSILENQIEIALANSMSFITLSINIYLIIKFRLK